MEADLELVKDFLNTVDVEEGTDVLAEEDAATRWFADRGLLRTGERVDPPGLELARALRSALREIAAAHHDQQGDPAAAARFTDVARRLPLRAVAGKDGSVRVGATGEGVAAALGGVVAAVAQASAVGSWTRVKLCAADTCRWTYVDSSKNRSRRWCAMGVCGNRQKTRSYRERQRDSAVGVSD